MPRVNSTGCPTSRAELVRLKVDIIVAVTTHAAVESEKGHMRYMIDGDLYDCDGPLHVSIGPRVRIVVGT